MMPALDKVGVKGLGVLADGLRKPIAVRKPLLDPADWRGITFAAFRSRESSGAIRALGATPSNVVAVPLDQGLDSGTVEGFEANLRLLRSEGGFLEPGSIRDGKRQLVAPDACRHRQSRPARQAHIPAARLDRRGSPGHGGPVHRAHRRRCGPPARPVR